MRSEFKNLRLKQLDRALEPYRAAREVPRPSKGWIRTIRQALGVSSGELARRLGTSSQLPLQLEKGEAEDRVLGVEHSMVLENQAVGRIDEAVETETRRLVRKRTSR